MAQILKMASLPEALSSTEALVSKRGFAVGGAWSFSQVLLHCAQSIEYSMTGYPRLKPWLVRATVGRLALALLLKRGYMRHDVSAPIPGAPAIEPTPDLTQALQKLRRSCDAFRSFERQLSPHFLLGPMSKQQYERLHAMHVADHLSAITSG